MVRHNLPQQIEPEQRELRQNHPLARDSRRQNVIES